MTKLPDPTETLYVRKTLPSGRSKYVPIAESYRVHHAPHGQALIVRSEPGFVSTKYFEITAPITEEEAKLEAFVPILRAKVLERLSELDKMSMEPLASDPKEAERIRSAVVAYKAAGGRNGDRLRGISLMEIAEGVSCAVIDAIKSLKEDS
jgi:hypothetical protein